MDGRDDVTALLLELGKGNRAAMDRLLPVVYEELRKLAHHHRYSWRETAPGTVSLVHEAYLKLVQQTQVDWQSRAQFFYIASRAMRSILIDNARRRQRQKRGGDRVAVPLDQAMLVSAERSQELLALDEALERLRESDTRLADVVDCRFFGGLTVQETAEALDVSPATVKRAWVVARTWLYRELRRDDGLEVTDDG